MIAPHLLTVPQTARVDRLCAGWNALRGDLRRQATREELISFLLQREEDEMRQMADDESDELLGEAAAEAPCSTEFGGLPALIGIGV